MKVDKIDFVPTDTCAYYADVLNKTSLRSI